MMLLLLCCSRVVLFSLGALHQTAISLRRREQGSVAAGGFAQSAVKVNEKARRSWRKLSDPGYD